MTDPSKMLITKDGVRVSPQDAEKFGLETEGEVKLRTTGDRPRTTTALGRAAVKDDKTGRVITSAAERGADDGGTPYGENTGLGDVTKTPSEVPVAPQNEDNPSGAADKDNGDGGTSASDTDKRSGDADGNDGEQPKGRSRRAAGH